MTFEELTDLNNRGEATLVHEEYLDYEYSPYMEYVWQVGDKYWRTTDLPHHDPVEVKRVERTIVDYV